MSVSEGESVKLRGNIRRQKSCSTDNFEYVVMNLLHRHDFKTTIAIATQKLDGINQQIDRPVCEVHSIQLIADQQQRTPVPAGQSARSQTRSSTAATTALMSRKRYSHLRYGVRNTASQTAVDDRAFTGAMVIREIKF